MSFNFQCMEREQHNSGGYSRGVCKEQSSNKRLWRPLGVFHHWNSLVYWWKSAGIQSPSPGGRARPASGEAWCCLRHYTSTPGTFLCGLDGASAFVEPPVVADAVQAGGHRADAWVTLQAAHAAVRVQRVGKSLPLLHVRVGGGEVTRDNHGDGVLQLLSALVPKAGAHGLEVQHLSVNVAQAAARRPSSASTDCAHPAASGWRGGRGGWVHRTVDVSARLAVVSEQCPLLSVPLLVLSVHGHEAQHRQVEEGSDHGQSRQDVDEAEGHVFGLGLKSLFILQGHVVPKADGGERNEAVVISVEETPSFKVGKGLCPYAQRAHAGYDTDNQHVDHGDLGAPHSKALFQTVKQISDTSVDAFTNALEHDQSEGDAQKCVHHAEYLPSICAGSCMAIS